MGYKHDSIVGRADLFKVNPEKIEIVKGWNPREQFTFDEQGTDDYNLMQSIKSEGVLVPLEIKRQNGSMMVIDGERRLRACKLLIKDGYKIESIPATLVRKGMSDIEAGIRALVRNTGKPLTPMEQAKAYQRLKNWGVEPTEIARRLGKSKSHVYDRLKLIDLAPDVQKAIQDKDIELQQAREIIKQSDGNVSKQLSGLKKAIADKKQKTELKKQGKTSAEVKAEIAKAANKKPSEPKIKMSQIDSLVDRFTASLKMNNFKSDAQKHRAEGVLIACTMLQENVQFSKAKDLLELTD